MMIGLNIENKALLRAYSIASPNWYEELEFYSIKVDDGPLTSRLQNLQKGNTLLVRDKSVGTLVHDALIPGKRLILFSTGTGIAPFVSIIRDPETYEKFDEIILFQTCRENRELEFGRSIIERINKDDILRDMVSNKLRFIPTTTREPSEYEGRITDWLIDKKFAQVVGKDLNSEEDRVMICGSFAMLNDFKKICLLRGLKEGSNSSPAHFVIEKAFVD
jgi:ferredoxin--NADP+ reductase